MKPLDRFRLIRRFTLPGSSKCLLLILATHANSQGVCWPGLSLLARETGYSVRTVRSAFKLLQTQGVLITRHRKGRSTLVSLTLEAFKTLATTPATIAAPPRQQLPPEVAHVKAKPARRPRRSKARLIPTPRNVVNLFPEARK